MENLAQNLLALVWQLEYTTHDGQLSHKKKLVVSGHVHLWVYGGNKPKKTIDCLYKWISQFTYGGKPPYS